MKNIPLFTSKARHFFGKLARSRPSDLPGMIVRRAYEAISPPPQGIKKIKFGEVSFDIDLSLHAIARKYYFKTHEMFLENIFKRHLSPGKIFIDIGANMGYWSAFSANLVGREGEVHSFEPVPVFFVSIKRLSEQNREYKIFANNMAMGSSEDILDMAVVVPRKENFDNFDTNIGSSSLLPGFLDHASSLVETIQVPVIALDDYIDRMKVDIERIGLIKIDVEGFESFVLDGMKKILNKRGRRIPILCEILTDPLRDAHLNGAVIVDRLAYYGYKCLDVTTLKAIDIGSLSFEENIICI